MRLATSGSIRSFRAHILITDQVQHSLINSRFANTNNLFRTPRCERGITTNICAGPVEVPTPSGRYISTFPMVVQPTIEPFDVILGCDWISECRPVLTSDRVEEAREEVRDSLPFGHRWLPGRNESGGSRQSGRSVHTVVVSRCTTQIQFSSTSSADVLMYEVNVPKRHARFYLSDGTIILRVISLLSLAK